MDANSFMDAWAELVARGEAFVAVTLVETIGSAPQDAGSKMLVTAAGLAFGTVGGGRVEARAIAEAQELLADGDTRTRFHEWNLQRDIGMTCGGVVKVYFEAVRHDDWPVVVFGAGHVAQALARVLMMLPCRVTFVDPRAEWLARLPKADNMAAVQGDDAAAMVARLPSHAFVLCMTMGHRTDRPILEAVFRRDTTFPYVGVIGSRGKASVLRRELLDAGIDEDRIDFRCPVGLPIGTNHPAEIAISIAAELLQVRDAARKAAD